MADEDIRKGFTKYPTFESMSGPVRSVDPSTREVKPLNPDEHRRFVARAIAKKYKNEHQYFNAMCSVKQLSEWQIDEVMEIYERQFKKKKL